MKIKVTLLIAQCDNKKSIHDDNFFKIFFTKKNTFPFKWISSKNEKQTLKEVSESCLRIDFDWMKKELADFRVMKDDEGNLIAEVVYISYIPEILGILKSGKFLTETEIIESKIELDEFYAEIFSRRGRSIFR